MQTQRKLKRKTRQINPLVRYPDSTIPCIGGSLGAAVLSENKKRAGKTHTCVDTGADHLKEQVGINSARLHNQCW